MRIIFTSIFTLFTTISIFSQTYNNPGGTINTCAGTFYDTGGSGSNYGNNQNITTTFCATNATDFIRLTFTAFDLEDCCDQMQIYNGPTTASPLIGTYAATSPGTITSTGQCLTVRFTSDGSLTFLGWAATISCIINTPPANYNNPGGTINTCNGTFYDTGSSGGQYANNENITTTICSNSTDYIRVAFSQFSTEFGFDALSIYNGANTTAPLIGTYSGTNSPGTITGSGTCLTFVFTSDGSIQSTGWTAAISCVPTAPVGGPACPAVNAGADVNLCGAGCTTLNATTSSGYATTNYTVGQIPYTPFSYNTGTTLNLGIDDQWTQVVTLPFSFSFYGTCYTQCVFGANGLLSFDITKANTYNTWPITAGIPGNTEMNNAIACPYHDIDPSVAGDIQYFTGGTAPCRYLVVSWAPIPMYSGSCNSMIATQQIVLYETTNIIETYILNKPLCTSWNSGAAIHGIQNATGTAAVVVPGRNYPTQWTATNDAWRFTPSGAPTFATTWFQGVGTTGPQIGTGSTVQVCPNATTTYTARTVYTTCTTPVTVTDNVVVNIGTALTATASDNDPCVGATLNLTSGTIPGATYTWVGPGSYTSNTANPSIANATTAMAGTYILKIANASGCTATTSTNVVISTGTTGITATPASICVGQSSTLSVPAGTAYSWSTSATTQSINVSPGVTTTYNVSVTATGGCTATASFTVTVTSSITPTITETDASGVSNDGIICPAGSATLTASGGTSYAWSNSSNTASTTVNPLVTTTYTVTATSASGCTGTASYTVTVTTNPVPTIAETDASGVPNDGIVCPTGSATLTASGGATYSWSNTGATAAITVTPATNTTYTVTATDALGCTASVSYTVTASPNPTPAIAETDASGVPNDGVVCPTGSATLTASGAATYSWSTGGVNPITVSPAANTTYSVTATNTAGCTATTSYTVTVTTNPVPAIAETDASGVPNDGVVCPLGSATLTASGGATYSWSAGGVNPITVSPVANTTYSVTATNTAGCTATTSYTVTVTTNPIPTIAETDASGVSNDGIVCPTGSATLTASGGATYSWSAGGANPITVSPSSTTTYTVTATDALGCTASVSYTVTASPNPTPIIAETDASGVANDGILCPTGSATLTASGGATYAWSNAGATAAITVTPAANTTYTVTATNTAGCTATTSYTVTVTTNPVPTIAETDASGVPNDGVVCPAGSATLTASGGATYSWSNLGATAAITVTPAANTTYSVTAANAAGCTTTTSYTVTVTTNPIPTIAETDASGVSNDGIVCPLGAATLTASGGATYSWSTGGANPITVSPSSTTTYTVTATDALGCTASVSYTVTASPNPTPIIAETDASGVANDGILCPTGSATLTASGGATYSWSTGGANPITVSPAANTTYSVTATNTAGCTATTSYTVTVTTNPVPTIAETDASGVANDGVICPLGSATLTASGGATYSWSAGGVNPITVSPVANTTYSVTATNTAGCTATTSYTVTVTTNPIPTIAETDPSGVPNDGIVCPTGSATLTASGGATYSWSAGGANPITVSPSSTTTYTVTATDALGCTASVSYTVTASPNPTPAIAETDASGVANDGILCPTGSATLTASGGATYAWSNAGATAAITVTPAANTTYTVTATNTAGCTATTSYTVTVTTNPVPTIAETDASGVPNDGVVCPAGSATLTASGGATYSWSNLGATAAITVTPAANTTYSVTAANAAGCTATTSYTVTVTTNPIPTIAETDASGVSNDGIVCPLGAATLTASGGATYSWSTGGANPITVSPSSTTTYTVTATDALGCTASVSYTVTASPNPTPAIAETDASGVANDGILCPTGSATLTASGGATYSWDNASVTAAITVSPAANTTYTVTATNAAGCTATTSYTVTVTTNPVPAIAETDASGVPNDGVVCPAGSATLTASGGATYSWSAGGANPITVSPVANTTYTVTATNTAGCTATTSYTVTVTTNPIPTIAETDASGVSNDGIVCPTGSATLTASGAATYSWSAGGANPITVSPSSTTTYTVTATDALGCTASVSYTVTASPNPTPAIAETDASGVANDGILCPTGSATLTASGGATYSWDNASVTAAITVSPAANTTYTVTATNAAGCTATTSYTVTVTTNPVPAIAETDASGVQNDGILCPTGSATLTASGGATYSWSAGGANPITVSPVTNTTYTVTATNTAGCTATTSYTVTVTTNPIPTIAETDASGVPNDGIVCPTGSATLTASGAATYSWSAGGVNPITVSPSSTTTYTVTATDALGCTASVSYTVTASPNPTPAIAETDASGVANDGILCPTGSATLTASGGATYTWDNGGINPITVSPVSTTTYAVTATNAAGCTAAIAYTVTVTANPIPTIVETDASGVANDGILCLGGSGNLSASGALSYTWSTAGTTASIAVSPLATTLYSVTATDIFGCTGTTAYTVTVTSNPTVTATAVGNPYCVGEDISLSAAAAGGTGTLNYNWSGQGFASAGANVTIANANTAMNGAYNVTVSDTNGCVGSSSVVVTVTAPATLAPSNGTNPYCINETVSIATNATGGTGTLNYAWTGPVGFTSILDSPSFTATATAQSGTYVVLVTDANGCTASAAIPVNIVTNPDLVLDNVIQPTCNGACNGSVELSLTNGTAPFVYTWTGGLAGEDPVNVCASTYAVTVTDFNGCSDVIASVVVAQPAALAVVLDAATPVSCFGVCDGTISTTATGGTAPYTYQWSLNSIVTTQDDPTGLCAGAYGLTLTDANGCTATLSANIGTPAALSATHTVTGVSCAGLCNGAVNISPSGGTAPYNFSWTGPAGYTAATEDVSALCAGDYTVVISDANGCQFVINNISIVEPVVLSAVATPTDALCANSCDGSIALSPSGGTAPYTYLWSDGATTQNAGSLCVGTYGATVTDANGCTFTVSGINISSPTAINAVATPSPATCAGTCNGSISLVTTGGTPTYTFQWSNGSSNQNLTALCAGAYSATISDAAGCAFFLQNVAVSEPTALSVSQTSIVNPTCSGLCNGSAAVAATGGTAPYTYLWSNGQTTDSPVNICTGLHTVTVTDANGCQTTFSVTLTEPAALQATLVSQVNVSCFGVCDGSLDMTISGGTAPYTYQWSNGTSTEDQTNLCQGAYGLTVTDANGCQVSLLNLNITEPQPLLFSVQAQTDATCNQLCNGTISTTATGGTASYTYNWSNGGNTSGVAGLCAGTYSVTISDANGCQNTITNIIIAEPAPFVTSTTQVDVLCNGGNNGSIDLTVSGSTPPYTYLWSSAATTEDVSGLAAGAYTVTVTDANGCATVTGASIIQPQAIALSETHTDLSCNNSANGSINLTPTGGTTPYTFSWSVPATTEDVNGLAAGTYSVTVTDANACSAVLSVTLTEPTVLSAAVTNTLNATCSYACNGQATVTPQGGTPNAGTYQYQWSNGQTVPTATGLCPNVYNVIVTDANGCTATATTTVTAPAAIDINISTTPLACFGGNDGTAAAAVTGGIAPYNYNWSNNFVGQAISNLTGGNYALTVTDGNGCTAQEPFFISSPNPLDLVSQSSPATCFGQANATLSVIPSGGTAPYGYLWSTGQTSALATNLLVANNPYSVTMTDSHGCTISLQGLVVTQPQALVVNIDATTDPICNGDTNGTASTVVIGGTNPYSYEWSGGQTTDAPDNLTAGQHFVTVTDNNGCTATDNVVLSQPELLSLIAEPTDLTCYNDGSGVIILNGFNGGTQPYSVSLDGTTFFPNVNNGYQYDGLDAGNYTVYLQDAHGCEFQQSVSIQEPPQVILTAGADISIQLGETAQIQATITNAPTGTTLLWTPSETLSCNDCLNPVASPVTTTNYVLQWSNPDGCSGEDDITVHVELQRNVFIPSAFSPNDDDVNDIFTVMGGLGVRQVKKLAVYDRWGELVWQGENFAPSSDIGWDGTFKGKPVNPAVFVYFAEIEFIDNVTLLYKGDVTVVK